MLVWDLPCVPWHSVTVPVSPPQGHRGACAPPAPTARSRRGGSARAVLVLLTNNSVSLCRGLVPGSRITNPSWFTAGGSPCRPGPRCCVPQPGCSNLLAGKVGGLQGTGGDTLPEGLTHSPRALAEPSVLGTRLARAPGYTGLGAPGSGSGISKPPGFSSPCVQACGDLADKAQPEGESCSRNPGITPAWGCSVGWRAGAQVQ